MSFKKIAGGVIRPEVRIARNVKLKEPLFFCFGLKGKTEEQLVAPYVLVESGAEVTIVAHCSFPHAEDALHSMEGIFEIGEGAIFKYNEHHYHGEKSGARVLPKLKVKIAQGGEFSSNFNLSKGSVGKVVIEVEAFLEKEAKILIESKVLGKNGKDDIQIIDKVYLNGEDSRAVIKMRAAAKDGGKVFMQGEMYARAAGAAGHVDCQEIVVGIGSTAKAVPIVEVSHEEARVTHEASVGKINQKELETLMTRGLDENQATEMIIEAMMK